MAIPSPNPLAEGPSGSPAQRWWLLLIPLGALLLLLAIVLIVILGVMRGAGGEEANPGMSISVIKLTPTPFSPPPPSGACETIISSGAMQVVASLPISLTVAGQVFPVVAFVSEQAEWAYPADGSGAAVWVCGTVVNYLVGLEPTAENEALLAALRPGDEIELYRSNGSVLFFRFVELQQVEENDATVFEQSQPGLTLIVLGEDGMWQIAKADYATEREPVQPPSETLAQPGQAVWVGDVQVTVERGHVERGAGSLAPGTMVYLVEFTVQNSGTVALDAGAFGMDLRDGVGNVYLPSPAAVALGDYGPLEGGIAPGAAAQGTAGYVVPEALGGPALLWTFRPWPGSDARASVSIPYEGGAGGGVGPEPAGRAQVTIADIFVDEDVLVIEGEVRNVGDGVLTVEVDGITLSSSAGMGELRMAAPPLPWSIEPGQTQIVELQYDVPGASTALLTLLGYSFEIGGLD